MPNPKLLIQNTPYTLNPIMTTQGAVQEDHNRGAYFIPQPVAPYVAAASHSTYSSMPTSEVSADEVRVKEDKGTLLDAQAAYIKINPYTGIPTQFSLAVADGLGHDPDPQVHAAIALAAAAVSEHFVTQRENERVTLQSSGIPIKDLTPAFHDAARYCQAVTFNGGDSALAACHVQLLANGKYYAHIGNVGDGMVVVVGADGEIKYQTGATSYFMGGQGASYRPTPITGLLSSDGAQGFRKNHLTQHSRELADGDVVLLLTDGATAELDTEVTMGSIGSYTYHPAIALVQQTKTIEIKQKKTTLKPDALYRYVRANIPLHETNTRLLTAIFNSVITNNNELGDIAERTMDAFNKLFLGQHFEHPTLAQFVNNLPLNELDQPKKKRVARANIKADLVTAGYDLDSKDLLQLWKEYSSYIQNKTASPLWKFIPFCTDNTAAFLRTLLSPLSAQIKRECTLDDLLKTTEGKKIRSTIQKLYMTAGGDGTVYQEQSYLTDFLADLFHTHRGDCTSVMVFKVPCYKTELIRSWITTTDPAVRAELLKLMVKAEITTDDLHTARDTLAAERYTTEQITPNGVKKDVDSAAVLLHESYPNIYNRLYETQGGLCLHGFIRVIEGLSQFPLLPQQDTFNRPINVSTQIVSSYIENITQFIATCIGEGATLQPIEIRTAASTVVATYCNEQLLPKIIAEMERYIAKAPNPTAGAGVVATADDTRVTRLQTVVRVLSQMRGESPFTIQAPSTTTWLLRTRDSRTPSQIKIDEKVKQLEAEIKALTPKSRLSPIDWF